MGMQVDLWPGFSFTFRHSKENAAACEQRELQETSTAVMEDGSPEISQEAPASTGAQQRGQPGPWGYTSASHQL